MIKRPRVFVDMDGVLVDFDGFIRERGWTPEQAKFSKGAYLAMQPIAGAIEGIRKLSAMGFDVFIATKPPTGIAHAYQDKAQWVFDHLPELSKKLIVTSDKGLLGDELDYLIDDRIHKANCGEFKGTLYEFKPGMTWDIVLDLMEFERRLILAREAA